MFNRRWGRLGAGEDRLIPAMRRARPVSQLRATLTLSKYSLIATLRSPTSVVFSLAFPIFFIIIFGSLVGDNGGPIKVAVTPGCDTVNPIYKAIGQIPAVRLETGLGAAEIGEAIKKGTISAELSIVMDRGGGGVGGGPAGGGGIGSGPAGGGGVGSALGAAGVVGGVVLLPHYRVSLAAPDPASRAMNLLRMVTNASLRELDRRAFPRNPSLASFSVVRVPGHLHKAIDFVLPGQLGFSLLMAGVFGSSFLLFSLRQNFVLKRLRATPVRKRSIIGGEMLSRLFFHVIGFLIMVGLGYFVFDFTLVNGWVTVIEMLLFSLFGLGIFMGIGFIISGVVQNEHSVTPVANTLTLPQILLCGLFFPIESYPHWLQSFCQVLPLTFFVDGLRKIAFDGLHFWQLPVQMGGLLLWTAVIGVWAVKAFKWE